MRTVVIAAGDDLVSAIRELAGAWVQAVGFVSDVALSLPSGDGEQTVELPGRSALVSLQGPPGGPLMATVSSASQAGPVLVGGRLNRATAAGVTVLVQDAEPDEASAAAELEPEEDDEAEELPEYNDRVLHPKFGLCDVMVVKGERMKIREVAGLNRVREIHLSVVKVLPPREQDGKRVFPLAKRGA